MQNGILEKEKAQLKQSSTTKTFEKWHSCTEYLLIQIISD